MWWLVAAAALFFFRGKIAQLFAPFLGDAKKLSHLAFYGHCVTVIAGVLYVLPVEFIGLGGVKKLFWLSCMWSTVTSCMLTLGANYGSPPFPENFQISNWRQGMQEVSVKLQPWLQQAMTSADFPVLFFALIFLAAHPTIWVLLILGRRSLWSVCTVCAKEYPNNRLWKMFEPRWNGLKAQNNQILEYSAFAEVGLGLWLTVALFLPMRQILTCILYWNYLKMRFQMPRSNPQHAKAWGMIGQRVDPLFKALPILNKPLDMAKNWFKPPYR